MPRMKVTAYVWNRRAKGWCWLRVGRRTKWFDRLRDAREYAASVGRDIWVTSKA